MWTEVTHLYSPQHSQNLVFPWRLSGFGGAVEGTSLASCMHLPVQGCDARLSVILTEADQFQALSVAKNSCLFPKWEFPHLHQPLLQLHPHHNASCSFPSLPAPLLAGSQGQRLLWPVGVVCHIQQLRGKPCGPEAGANVRRTGSTRDAGMAKQLTAWPWASHLTSACLS